VLRLIGALLLLGSPVASAYYDDTAGDKQVAYEYLDQVEKDVGYEAFAATPEALTLQLALTLGKLDKVHLTSKGFIQHLHQVATARDRFYQQRKLTTEDVVAYLLPYRIRYEHTSKPEWLTTLARQFVPLTTTATTADEAAKAILAWIPAHVKLLDPALSYPLPIRGDLDPLTVLKGGYGNELDCAIFGVAALRASGVAARFVWAPALRGERGGKAWLEYLSENTGDWLPWVPSYGAVEDHAAELKAQIGSKILFVMARPEAPLEVTGSYTETVEIIIHSSDESLAVQLLTVGRDQLLSARGNEITRNERQATIGVGSVVIAASFGMRSFALLPLECAPGQEQLHITAESGSLAILQDAPKSDQPSTTKN